MLVDVNELKSHPNKRLFTHIDGVISNVKKVNNSRSSGKLAELVAIFHDLGKINPYFQKKLENRLVINNYSNHAYFSAFSFFCAFRYNRNNFLALKDKLSVQELTQNQLIALTIIIAKHHGHLGDFTPSKDNNNQEVLSAQELKRLFSFIHGKEKFLLTNEFMAYYIKGLENIDNIIYNQRYQERFLEEMIFDGKITLKSLDFFLDTQFTFASLIYADKSDAADFSTIDESKRNIANFSSKFPSLLRSFLSTLKPNTELNELRTKIRIEASKNIKEHLNFGKRIFELTAPTGSGKTLMMLNLASDIIKVKGDFRIIFALPFLSITEQIENVVKDVFPSLEQYIQRIDSKSINPRFEEIQKELDSNPSDQKVKELGSLSFEENVFAYPFIITTFVRFFETLLSNHNATLLKLPNFSNSIFLLDEIQSLPPRLYTFFVAYLTKFCEKFNSYAIISTATQPNFNLPNQGHNSKNAKIFFKDYDVPSKLLEHDKFFASNVFNRYRVFFKKDEIDLLRLNNLILSESYSVLVILNTIDDSKDLYNILRETLNQDELILLNTHFTPNDRRKKISFAKERLKSNERIIVVSTQLIEAGVDIDFPIVYRDFAPVPSIVQSAGRCNRNGKLIFGKVFLFRLRNRDKIRSELIYGRGNDRDILLFTKQSWISESYEEKQLLSIQKLFFSRILKELNFAIHHQEKFKLQFDFIKDISACKYQKIGKFQLIDEQAYGENVRYFVPTSNQDDRFENLLSFQKKLDSILHAPSKTDYSKIAPLKFKIQELLKKMSGDIVQVRLKANDPRPFIEPMDFLGLFKLDTDFYSFEKGVILDDLVGIL